MHMLHLLRHAKSDRDEAIDDHDRPLSRRGRETARRVGETLPAALGPVDLVLCSTARRTRETAGQALAFFVPRPPLRFEDVLYLAPSAVLLRRLRQLDENTGSVLLIGHNPGVHELARQLARENSPRYRAMAEGKFPTAARASLRIAGPWASLGETRYELVDYVTPKSRD